MVQRVRIKQQNNNTEKIIQTATQELIYGGLFDHPVSYVLLQNTATTPKKK